MIVVTGAAGMIGSNLIAELNHRGRSDILAVDRLGKGEKWRNLRGLRFADYCEAEVFYEWLQKGGKGRQPDAVFHLGACSSTLEDDMGYLARNNFDCSKLVAQYAVTRGIRLIVASSAATYGAGENGYADAGDLHRLRPLNKYAWSKHLFDLWALENGILGKMTVLKYFNVYGPNEWHKGPMRSMVLKGFEQARDTGEIRLFRSWSEGVEDGGQRRDFVYVKDAVEATAAFLDRQGACGVFNVGSGEARTWNDLARAIFAAIEKEPVIRYIDPPADLAGQYQVFTRANVGRIGSAFGRDLRPPTSLEQGVYNYVTRYLLPGCHVGDIPYR